MMTQREENEPGVERKRGGKDEPDLAIRGGKLGVPFMSLSMSQA